MTTKKTRRDEIEDEQRQRLVKYEDSSESDGLLASSKGCGSRHTLTLWAFLGFVNLFILRVDMSIALVAMATQSSNDTTPNVNSSECDLEGTVTKETKEKAEFEWSNSLQGFVLSAFYYGYFATQIPGSLLAGKIGGKKMFAVAMAGCSALALLTPLSARLHVGILIANRVLQGCLQGIVFPSMQMMLSKWAPAKERSRLVAFTYAGCQAGTVAGLLSAGYICSTSAGWPVVFYLEGVLGLLWCVGWIFCVFESPAEHPRIKDVERIYIESSIDRSTRQTPSVPWLSVLTSPALYAIAGAHFANDWGCFAVMTCLPKFMKDILHYDMSQNGFLTSLPYLVMWGCNMMAGTLADFLRAPGRLRTVHVRKLMVTIGLIGPGSLLVTAAYLPGCSRIPVVALLTAAMGLSGFTIAGHSVNHLDIAPVFAAVLFALTNSFGTTSGWIGPALAGALTNHRDDRQSWQTFFLVSGGVYATGGLLFVLLARGHVQSWARVKDDLVDHVVPAPSYGSTQVPDDDSNDDADRDEGRG